MSQYVVVHGNSYYCNRKCRLPGSECYILSYLLLARDHNRTHVCKRGGARCFGLDSPENCLETQHYLHLLGYRRQHKVTRNVLVLKRVHKRTYKVIRLVNEWIWLRRMLKETGLNSLFPSLQSIRNFYLHHPVMSMVKDLFKVDYISTRHNINMLWLESIRGTQ